NHHGKAGGYAVLALDTLHMAGNATAQTLGKALTGDDAGRHVLPHFASRIGIGRSNRKCRSVRLCFCSYIWRAITVPDKKTQQEGSVQTKKGPPEHLCSGGPGECRSTALLRAWGTSGQHNTPRSPVAWVVCDASELGIKMVANCGDKSAGHSDVKGCRKGARS